MPYLSNIDSAHQLHHSSGACGDLLNHSVLVINGLCGAVVTSSGSAGCFLAFRVVGDLTLISLDTSTFVMRTFSGAISAFIDNCWFTF